MRLWIIAAAAALVAGAACAGGRLAQTPERFHGVTVLSEWRASNKADTPAAHVEYKIGPFDADAVVFLNIEGTTVAQVGETDVMLKVAATRDGERMFGPSGMTAQPASGAASISGGSRLYLPKGESSMVRLDVTRSGGAPAAANAQADLHGLAIAAPKD